MKFSIAIVEFWAHSSRESCFVLDAGVKNDKALSCLPWQLFNIDSLPLPPSLTHGGRFVWCWARRCQNSAHCPFPFSQRNPWKCHLLTLRLDRLFAQSLYRVPYWLSMRHFFASFSLLRDLSSFLQRGEIDDVWNGKMTKMRFIFILTFHSSVPENPRETSLNAL